MRKWFVVIVSVDSIYDGVVSVVGVGCVVVSVDGCIVIDIVGMVYIEGNSTHIVH